MTEVNITPEQGGDTQAQIDAMVAKAEGKETPAQPLAPETPAERPAWLPEKFATPEDMAKAYAEMERKQSAPQETPKADDKAAEATQAEADQAAADVVQAAGLSMDALAQQVMQNGDLDEASYEALAKQGITKEMAQSYVAGQQAIADKLVNDMHAQVGGQEAFDNLLSWAGENLSPAEIEAFNNTVDTGSEAAVKMALSGLQARHKAEAGSAPNLIGGKRGGAASGDVFRSTAEVTKAMSDPRYARDPAYRADVMAKLGRSKVM